MLCIFHAYRKNIKQVQKYIDLKKKYLELIDNYINNTKSLKCPERFFSNLKKFGYNIVRTDGGKKLTKPKVKKLTKHKVKKPSKPKVKNQLNLKLKCFNIFN